MALGPTIPIVGSAGVTAGAPFTIGRITYITNDVPPVIVASPIMAQVTGANEGIVISAAAVDPQPGATERLRVKGGAILEGAGVDSVAIGRLASAPAANGIAIGRAATTSGVEVAIGNGASVNSAGCLALGASAAASGNVSTAIGSAAVANGGGGTGGAVAVGAQANATGIGAIAIGFGPTASAIAAVAIGRATVANAIGAVVIGSTATANGFRVILLAGGATVTARANEQIWIHAGGTTPNTVGATGGVIFLGGDNGAGVAVTHANSIIIGMNQGSIAANTVVLGGVGTPITQVVIGQGDTSTAAVAAGLTIRCTNGITTANLDMGPLVVQAPLSTGNAGNGKITFKTGAVQGAGAVQQPATTQLEILPSAGGAGAPSINIANVTNGAAAAAGTLANSPVAGNPTFWIPVQVNGVNKFIPAW
jgi:hypothetical protein